MMEDKTGSTDAGREEPADRFSVLLPTPFQIGLGEGRVQIDLFHDRGVHGLIFKDTGEPHPIGSGAGDIPEEDHEPEPGEIYIACFNRESAVVLQEMVNSVVASFDVAQAG